MKNHYYKDKSIINKLRSLMRSDSYQDWLQGFYLSKRKTPGHIKTFDSFDSFFKLDIKSCFINDMLYDLELALNNEGMENLNLLKTRADICQWVYLQFTEESDLNIANFRIYEAESRWEIGETSKAEELFKKVILKFPNFAYGYIFFGDCYWQSDWSYQHGPNYVQAEQVYREALNKQKMEDIDVVQERLDSMIFEKNNPKEREKYKSFRIKRIQSRTELS